MARGHIRQRGKGTWAVVVSLGRDPLTGERRRQWVSVKGTKRDAERRLTELLQQQDTGAFVKPGKLTTAEFLRQWLRDYAATNVRPRTYVDYARTVEGSLIPALGSIQLAKTGRDGNEVYANFPGTLGAEIAPSWRAVAVSRHAGPYVANETSHAPHGMGMLLAGGYLSDAAVFYCPSAKNMPAGCTNTREAPAGLANWRSAGGTSAEVMLRGDWNGQVYRVDGTWSTNVIFSNYAYRNVPLMTHDAWHVGMETDGDVVYPMTKPRIPARTGQGVFRTSRETGGRALVSDAWDKGYSYNALGKANVLETNDIAESRTLPGMGIRAHRSAYNVLYGDGHAGVFGDPQERLIWHSQGYATNQATPATLSGKPVSSNAMYTFFLANNAQSHFRNNCGHFYYDKNGTKGIFDASPHGIWHDFDASVGIDVP